MQLELRPVFEGLIWTPPKSLGSSWEYPFVMLRLRPFSAFQCLKCGDFFVMMTSVQSHIYFDTVADVCGFYWNARRYAPCLPGFFDTIGTFSALPLLLALRRNNKGEQTRILSQETCCEKHTLLGGYGSPSRRPWWFPPFACSGKGWEEELDIAAAFGSSTSVAVLMLQVEGRLLLPSERCPVGDGAAQALSLCVKLFCCFGAPCPGCCMLPRRARRLLHPGTPARRTAFEDIFM